jgi:hypothetical protein
VDRSTRPPFRDQRHSDDGPLCCDAPGSLGRDSGCRWELLQTIPATIKGGTVSAEIPGFPAGTLGTVQMRYSPPEDLDEKPPEPRTLPRHQAR